MQKSHLLALGPIPRKTGSWWGVRHPSRCPRWGGERSHLHGLTSHGLGAGFRYSLVRGPLGLLKRGPRSAAWGGRTKDHQLVALVASGRSGRGVLPGRSWGWFPWGRQRDGSTPPGLGPCCLPFGALITALPAAAPLALSNGRATKILGHICRILANHTLSMHTPRVVNADSAAGQFSRGDLTSIILYSEEGVRSPPTLR